MLLTYTILEMKIIVTISIFVSSIRSPELLVYNFAITVLTVVTTNITTLSVFTMSYWWTNCKQTLCNFLNDINKGSPNKYFHLTCSISFAHFFV